MTDLSGIRRCAAAVLLALLLVVVACSGGAGEPSDRAGSSAPTSTPASRAPDSRASGSRGPGTLLDATPYDGNLGESVRGWRIRYATTDSEGRPREATGLVVAPSGSERRGPVLAYAHPTVGIAESCAPSTGPMAGFAAAALASAARRGWVTVATDYSGLGTPGPHEYLVGPAAAHDVLDSVRATRELVPDSVEETVLWGHSQGGHAVLWAGAEAPRYAPDLAVVGVAAAAPPTDLAALVPPAGDDPTSNLLGALVLAAWDRVYADDLISLVAPENRDEVAGIAGSCLDRGMGFPAALRHAERLRGGLLPDAAYGGRVGRLLRQNSAPGPTDAPVLVVQGTADPVVPAEVTRAWADARCAEGVDVDYREFPGGHQLTAQAPVARAVMEWAAARAAGEQATSSCG